MDMRARIYQPYKDGLYCGQIYDEELKCWKQVTEGCFTESGAKKQLKKWKKRKYPEEFEI